jgi:hypothetical protein
VSHSGLVAIRLPHAKKGTALKGVPVA